MNQLTFTLPVYEGPLDLLLDLIKKNEVNIYDIPIAEITKQYLEHLAEMQELNLEIAGEFLVMAATLLHIKSRMLLPLDPNPEDEEETDPRAELVRKLLEYQAFKEAARELELMESERGKVFTRQISEYYFNDLDPADFEPENFGASLSDLLQAFHKVLRSMSRENLHEVFEQVISIEDKIIQIRTLILEREEVVFTDLFTGRVTRNELIVTFLAVLEIVRQKLVNLFQSGMFGEILLRRK